MGDIKCCCCGESFTKADLAELRSMGEHYHKNKDFFLCPDCWDDFQRNYSLEEQAERAIELHERR